MNRRTEQKQLRVMSCASRYHYIPHTLIAEIGCLSDDRSYTKELIKNLLKLRYLYLIIHLKIDLHI